MNRHYRSGKYGKNHRQNVVYAYARSPNLSKVRTKDLNKENND